jgi:hypothetical protein
VKSDWLFVIGEEEEGFFKAGTFVPKGPLNESSMKMPLHGSAGILPACGACGDESALQGHIALPGEVA